MALGEQDEGFEEAGAVLGRGGEVAADRAELLGAGQGSHAAGDFLPDFDHADLALGRIVRSRCRLRVMRVLRSIRIGCG